MRVYVNGERWKDRPQEEVDELCQELKEEGWQVFLQISNDKAAITKR